MNVNLRGSMTEYTEEVERQRLLNDALEWGHGVKYIHFNNGIEETRFNNGSYKMTNPKTGHVDWFTVDEKPQTLIDRFQRAMSDLVHSD